VLDGISSYRGWSVVTSFEAITAAIVQFVPFWVLTRRDYPVCSIERLSELKLWRPSYRLDYRGVGLDSRKGQEIHFYYLPISGTVSTHAMYKVIFYYVLPL
jgi:hypothetical protein